MRGGKFVHKYSKHNSKIGEPSNRGIHFQGTYVSFWFSVLLPALVRLRT